MGGSLRAVKDGATLFAPGSDNASKTFGKAGWSRPAPLAISGAPVSSRLVHGKNRLRILGINDGLDAALVILEDGKPVFALQEERVTRRKAETGFPWRALDLALSRLAIGLDGFEAVALAGTGKGRAETRRRLKAMGAGRIVVVERHAAHAAAAYFGRRADPASPHLVLSLDNGESGIAAAVHVGGNGTLSCVATTPAGHAPGQIFAAATAHLGMEAGTHDYKLMGLAPYADPARFTEARRCLSGYLDLSPDEPLRFRRLVPEPTGAIGRRLARDLGRLRFDLVAGAAQAFAEDLASRWVEAAVRATGIDSVVAAGGFFMNVKVNKRLAEDPGLSRFDVFPPMSDEAFGAAWAAAARLAPADLGRAGLDTLCLGPAPQAGDATLARAAAAGLRLERLEDPAAAVARLLAAGKIVARAAGPMEFGARALGNRSILADPARPGVAERINKAIKQRDFWMPFAPAALAERAGDYAVLPPSLPRPDLSPFMMHGFETRAGTQDDIRAGTHPYDGSARLQTVDRVRQPDFHALLSAFARETGRAALLNTSFNLHGEPIVMSGEDALDVMMRSGLDSLLLEDVLVTKP